MKDFSFKGVEVEDLESLIMKRVISRSERRRVGKFSMVDKRIKMLDRKKVCER